jgi:RNA polymerase sigma factor (sigma-70 family)
MTDIPDRRELRRIARAIRRLPRRQRSVFRAIRFQNLTYAEIAERTGYSVAEVEALFARSLANLMRTLDGKPGGLARGW